ncbi:MAG: nucleotidyl transferase AbiEii/AbiGii toxin family protein [Burkholderiales bacterium]|nr:nucleotidyl transferase AbiEii/AbiGii toxin family protein [Burkholderiales bacterium]
MAEHLTRYRRPFHAVVQAALLRMDAGTMAAHSCYFGGGTRSVLDLDEYRESRDVDFLCAGRDGYHALRTIVAERGLQGLFTKPVGLVREARIDRDGIRAVLDIDGSPLKFEIMLEGRLESLEADAVPCNGVAQLSRASAFAEKFLANADRGLDQATLARDVVDLAHMAAGWGLPPATAGLRLAAAAYGKDVQVKLDRALGKLQADPSWRQRCERGLSVDRPKVLRAGLELLQAKAWRSRPPGAKQ